MSGVALSRRGLALGLAALPLAVGPAVAAPPSDLALACAWAVRHNAWISATPMSDDEVGLQVDRHEAVIVRAIEEPSRSAADLGAKARMLLDDIGEKEGLFDSPYNDDRLIVVVLREAAGLVEGGQ